MTRSTDVGAFRKSKRKLSSKPRPSQFPHLRQNAAWLVKESGQTNDQIAEELAVNSSTVWRWRRGLSDIRAERGIRQRFAAYFNVSEQDLLFTDLTKAG